MDKCSFRYLSWFEGTMSQSLVKTCLCCRVYILWKVRRWHRSEDILSMAFGPCLAPLSLSLSLSFPFSLPLSLFLALFLALSIGPLLMMSSWMLKIYKLRGKGQRILTSLRTATGRLGNVVQISVNIRNRQSESATKENRGLSSLEEAFF